MFKLVLGNAEEPEIKFPTSTGSSKNEESSRKTSTSASLTSRVDCVDHNKLWKILKEMRISDHFTCLLRNLNVDQETTEPDMEQLTGSKLEKKSDEAI